MSEERTLAHIANILATHTMEEFKEAAEAMAFDDDGIIPAWMAQDAQETEQIEEINEESGIDEQEDVDSNENEQGSETGDNGEEETEDEDEDEDEDTSTITAAPATAATSVAGSAIDTPGTPTTSGATTPASASRKACSECRRKKMKCVRPTPGASCTGCVRARYGPVACTI